MLSVAFAIALFTAPAYALEQCEAPIRTFFGGPGRRPGATVVGVFIRQKVENTDGVFVSAISKETLAKVTGDAVHISLEVKNDSIYPVGNVRLNYAYRRVPSEGPAMQGVMNVTGATYDPHGLFLVDWIDPGETVEVTFTMILDRDLDFGVSQSSIHLYDFMIMDPSSRFPERLPTSSWYGSVPNVEKVGIGGKEVSCYSADPEAIWAAEETLEAVVTDESPYAVIITPTISTEQITSGLSINKQASDDRPRVGQRVLMAITVRNDTSETLRDILVDDQFSIRDLIVVENGGGLVTDSGIQWLIEELDSGDEWSARYSVRVSDLRGGTSLKSTMTLFGEQLLDVPQSQLTETMYMEVAGAAVIASPPLVIAQQEISNVILMPQTGVNINGVLVLLFQILIGVMIGCSLFGVGMWGGLRRL